MKIKRKYNFEDGQKRGVARRQVEIEEGERIGIRILDRKKEPAEEREIISFFMPGVLTLEWERDAKLEK